MREIINTGFCWKNLTEPRPAYMQKENIKAYFKEMEEWRGQNLCGTWHGQETFKQDYCSVDRRLSNRTTAPWTGDFQTGLLLRGQETFKQDYCSVDRTLSNRTTAPWTGDFQTGLLLRRQETFKQD
jgi:hypothetical protein